MSAQSCCRTLCHLVFGQVVGGPTKAVFDLSNPTGALCTVGGEKKLLEVQKALGPVQVGRSKPTFGGWGSEINQDVECQVFTSHLDFLLNSHCHKGPYD